MNLPNCLRFVGLSFAALALAFQAAAQPVAIPGKYIVLLRPGASAPLVAQGHGVAADHVYQAAVNGFAGFMPPGRLRALQGDPRVAAIVPDYVVEANPKPGGGGGGGGGQVIPEGIKRVGAAPGNVLQTGSGVGVAVLDTGIDLVNADLKIGGSYSAFAGLSAQDGNGHGTHVAGTIAAQHNAIGVVGVAPNATLYAVKVLADDGNGSDASVIAGLNWVAQNHQAVSPPIRVVNMSLGRPVSNDDSAMHAAIQSVAALNIAVVVSAGNTCGNETIHQVPAAFAETLAIASTTAKDGKANRSGFSIKKDTASYFTTDGPNVAISAPGEDAEDVNNGGLITSIGILSLAPGGGTARKSGTSMAAPHVAGIVALMYEKYGPGLNREWIGAKLTAGASNAGIAPLNSPTGCYSFDWTREGVGWAPGALQ